MDRQTVTLERLRSFVRVVERGSMSAVARELSVGQSTISRHLRELEEAVGVPLVSRTTRRVTPTDEGRRYYDTSVQIIRLVDQAGNDARASKTAASGHIRLSCTAALGVRHVGRLLFEFQDQYPGIAVDFGITDERIDLVREGVDIAIRLGPVADSSMKLRSLGRSRQILVGATEYLHAHGMPSSPPDLATYEGVRMSNIAGSDVLNLRDASGTVHPVRFVGRLAVDHGLAARSALAAGRGIGPAHVWLVDDLLASGSLIAVLEDYELPRVPLNMLILPERAEIARVRLLIDYLSKRIPGLPGIAD